MRILYCFKIFIEPKRSILYLLFKSVFFFESYFLIERNPYRVLLLKRIGFSLETISKRKKMTESDVDRE